MGFGRYSSSNEDALFILSKGDDRWCCIWFTGSSSFLVVISGKECYADTYM